MSDQPLLEPAPPVQKLAPLFSRASDEWSTPQAFFDALDAEFGFELDVAASPGNEKCGDFLTKADAWTDIDWAPRVCWMNPPYSRCYQFIKKAAQEARQGATVVCLVPSRTDTRWWHSEVWDAEKHQPRPGVEIRFIKGRLKFGNSENSAPFPSVVVIFRPPAARGTAAGPIRRPVTGKRRRKRKGTIYLTPSQPWHSPNGALPKQRT